MHVLLIQTFNYSLVAMVPSGLLGTCSSLITRPSWEPLLKYFLVAGLLIGLAAASLMSYFEAGTIVASAVVATVRVLPSDSTGKHLTPHKKMLIPCQNGESQNGESFFFHKNGEFVIYFSQKSRISFLRAPKMVIFFFHKIGEIVF